jgi:C4-dicarboxylate-specific signal transduction histidine kinase
MLSSAYSDISADSVPGESACSADRAKAAKLDAPTRAAFDRLANAFPQKTDLRARNKSWPFEKCRNGMRPQIGATDLEANAEEGVSLTSGSTTCKGAEMRPRDRQWRYRTTLARANSVAALGEVSACIVHEVNQPVAAVVTNAQAALRFLEDPNPDLEEVRQALTRITRLGIRVVEIVRRTRARVQRTPSRQEDFEINEAIGEVIALNRGEFLKNAVLVDTRLAPDLPLVRADRIQVQQVILNLINNAVEAMGEVPDSERELRIVTCHTSAEEILVTVQDSGPGLGTHKPDRLFDAYYSTKTSGLGLGLSICRSIIEAHEGRLWASPSRPHGASFQFTLPVRTYRGPAQSYRSLTKPIGSAAVAAQRPISP